MKIVIEYSDPSPGLVMDFDVALCLLDVNGCKEASFSQSSFRNVKKYRYNIRLKQKSIKKKSL